MTLQAKAPWGDPELTRRKANQARRCGGDRGCAGHGFGEWIINKGVTPPPHPSPFWHRLLRCPAFLAGAGTTHYGSQFPSCKVA